MGSILNEDWTAEVVGRMHRFRITNLALAEACGYSAAYLSTVLNGHKQFESEDAKLKTKDRILNHQGYFSQDVKTRRIKDDAGIPERLHHQS